VNVPIFLRGKL